MALDSQRLRLSVLGIVALSLFCALFARLWYLQVIGTEEYQLAAAVQNTREIWVEAPRGRILDADGRVLVDNRISTVVTVDPVRLSRLTGEEADAMWLHLAEELTASGQPTKVAELRERMEDPQYSPVEPKPVAVDVNEELEIYLTERRDQFPAVEVRREPVRAYPYGPVAAHVLGYVGRINEDELREKMGTPERRVDTDKPYQPNDEIGKTGVEKVYEDRLRGVPGVRTIEVDARGEPIRTLSYEPPVPGNDVQLTIDLDVQLLAESALLRGLEEARGTPARGGNQANAAPAGSTVVIDPRTGGVLAMASYPSYDPEEFVNGISPERYEELLGDEASEDPFTNRALSGQYAPGSTFKLITAYAALRDGLISSGDWYTDGGTYVAQGCATGAEACTFTSPGAVGSVNVELALTRSSDVFFYWLGDRYWVEDGVNRTGIQDAAEEFGLHAETGIPLPYEATGFVPTPERKQQRHDENPEAFPYGEWYSGDNINMSIGQGDVLVTPLQLANAYATFANHGTLHAPNIAVRVLRSGGDPEDPADVVEELRPRILRQLEIPDATIWQPMYQGFLGVTSRDGGTVEASFTGWDHISWPIAGKTGTAEVEGKADTSVFVGFGPGTDPGYVVSVVLEESGFGAEAAAPVARWILEPLAGQAPMPEVRPE